MISCKCSASVLSKTLQTVRIRGDQASLVKIIIILAFGKSSSYFTAGQCGSRVSRKTKEGKIKPGLGNFSKVREICHKARI